jgi:hypothetical protein
VKEKNERMKQNFFALLGPFWFSQVAIICTETRTRKEMEIAVEV